MQAFQPARTISRHAGWKACTTTHTASSSMNRSTFVAASPTPDLLWRSTSASRSSARATPASPSCSAVFMNGPCKSRGQILSMPGIWAGLVPPLRSASALRTFSSQMPSQVTARNSLDGSLLSSCRHRRSASAVSPDGQGVGHLPHLLLPLERDGLADVLRADRLAVGRQRELGDLGVEPAEVRADQVGQQVGRLRGDLHLVGGAGVLADPPADVLRGVAVLDLPRSSG